MNIFNLTAPSLYRCHIFRYYNGLSRLYLRVFKGQQDIPAFYLLFSDVGYVDAPVTWQSADFRIAPPDDCIALLLQTGLIGQAILQFPDAYAAITENSNLYVVDTPHTPIRIIAGNVVLLPDISPDLK